MIDLIVWLIVGGAAGFVAGRIMNSGGLRLTGDDTIDTILTGIIGAVVGGFLFGILGISIGTGIANSFVTALIGACALIFGLRFLNR